MGALLFISHSGADTDDAVRLRAAILAHPAAVEAGLRVWLDKTDLVPGQPWQRQISDALDQARAFCVLIGARGIVNWVDNEVSVALDRATGPGAIAFIPVRASDAVPFERLPPFVRQYHGVTDPLGNPDALTALVLAATRAEQPEAAQPVTDRPFVGLQPMDETEADRFFGRTAELQALSATVQTHPITAIVADSGAGKSSLVRAGLVPAFRGGRLAEPDDPGAKDRIRIVLSMRPGADPLEGLRQAQDAAMVRLGLDYADRAAMRADLQVDDPAKAAFALTCGVPPERADLLLVVDQFEELLTQTDMAEASEFVAFLLALSQPSAHRSVKIVLTVRNDYFNLIRRHPALFQALTADGGAAQLRLRALAPEALAEIVLRPLAMAGHRDQNDQQALLAAIRAEISDRPGDLALVQIALEAAWERHRETGEPLSQAYTAVGGLRGALDTTAEKVRAGLSAGEQSTLPALLVRLVRLG
ncbi:MAG: TIR domain-containing protein, partial [Pseudomonadota bacterium]